MARTNHTLPTEIRTELQSTVKGRRARPAYILYAYVRSLSIIAGGKMNSESATRLTDLNGVDLVKKDTQEEVEKEYFCGIGRFRPKCLQIFRDAKFFTFILCSFCFIEGAAALGMETELTS